MDSGIIGVLGTVLGVLIGGPITYYYAKILIQETHKNAMKIAQIQEFNKAATEFRNAFLPELIFLKHDAAVEKIGSTDDISEVLRFGYIHRHLKALEVFKDYLFTEDRADIDKAWKQYCYNKDNPEILFFEQYFTGSGSKSEKEAKKTLALERIEDIIKFAKHK